MTRDDLVTILARAFAGELLGDENAAYLLSDQIEIPFCKHVATSVYENMEDGAKPENDLRLFADVLNRAADKIAPPNAPEPCVDGCKYTPGHPGMCWTF